MEGLSGELGEACLEGHFVSLAAQTLHFPRIGCVSPVLGSALFFQGCQRQYNRRDVQSVGPLRYEEGGHQWIPIVSQISESQRT